MRNLPSACTIAAAAALLTLTPARSEEAPLPKLGPNAVPLKRMKDLLATLVELDRVTKRNGFLETNFN